MASEFGESDNFDEIKKKQNDASLKKKCLRDFDNDKWIIRKHQFDLK